MPIKMIVTDLDGTLLHSDKTISDYSVAILNQCKARGIVTAFATARSERTTRQFQAQFTPDYIIANNGAIINCGSEVISRICIPPAIRDKLAAELFPCGTVKIRSAETGTRLYFNGEAWQDEWNAVYDFSKDIDTDITKLSVACADANLVASILSNYPEFNFYTYTGEALHSIMHRDATKLKAIAYVAEAQGITLKDIAAFGDDFNDIEMLKGCGVGVAMANAVDEAKSAADFICDSNDNDGVAKWLAEKVL